MIIILPYHPSWPVEFRTLARPIRAALGSLALRIDHIGSTSVPGLAAKDRIDIQVTVARLEPAVEQAFQQIGYTRSERKLSDHIPPGGPDDLNLWRKWFFRPPEQQRPTNVHVRILGLPNQRYPLLFRDYLRAESPAALAYAQVKTELARLHPDNVDAYYAVKDPVCDLIIAAAELWAAKIGWAQGPSDA